MSSAYMRALTDQEGRTSQGDFSAAQAMIPVPSAGWGMLMSTFHP